jgi:hypothetical protein
MLSGFVCHICKGDNVFTTKIDLKGGIPNSLMNKPIVGAAQKSPAQPARSRAQRYIENTLKLEGAWSNGAADPGGATMFGLSVAANPSLKYEIENATLTRDEAVRYIKHKYYDSLAYIDDLAYPLGYIVFDSHFHGMAMNIKRLQELYNTKFDGHLFEDGVWGMQSGRAFARLSADDQTLLVEILKLDRVSIAKETAAKTMLTQARLGKPVLDYTNGFIRRQNKRFEFALNV